MPEPAITSNVPPRKLMISSVRSARKDADVRKQEGKSCAGVAERLKTRGVAKTNNPKEAGLQPGKWCG